jgi:hypothetical protein
MRKLHTRLDAMVTTHRRAPNVGGIIEDESEEMEVEGVAGEDATEECLLRLVVKMGAREKMDIPMHEGNLDVEELLYWIRAMDNYFDYEDFYDENKVKHVVTRLKGHATLSWDELQVDR